MESIISILQRKIQGNYFFQGHTASRDTHILSHDHKDSLEISAINL